ncbi:hypothetical protein [Microbacterium sp.]|uniref:hypothetical protein n=1 Tax=Microbacterium sp. TaxID=51671 RepID=UPI003A863FC5
MVVTTFGSDGAALADILRERRASRFPPVSHGVSVVIVLIAALAPVVGVAVYGGWPNYLLPASRPVPAEIAVPVAGVCFMVSAITQVALWVVWTLGGARRSPMVLGGAAVSAVLAGFAVIGVARTADRDGYDLGPWSWLAWLTVVIGGSLALAVLVRFRSKPVVPVLDPLPQHRTLPPREQARMAVLKLSKRELRRIQADRDEALRVLAERGLLQPDETDRALHADLGTLFTLDPIRGET